MDSVPRLIFARARPSAITRALWRFLVRLVWFSIGYFTALIVVAGTLVFCREANAAYTGPSVPAEVNLLITFSLPGTLCLAGTTKTPGQLTACFSAYMASAGYDRDLYDTQFCTRFTNICGQLPLWNLQGRDVQSRIFPIANPSNFGALPLSGTQIPTCTGGLAVEESPTEPICVSQCKRTLDRVTEGRMAIVPGQGVTLNGCMADNEGQCEVRPVSVTDITYDIQPWRVGTWKHTGVSCAEATPVPSDPVLIGSAPSSSSSGGATSAQMAQVIANTSDSAGAGKSLKEIKAVLSPTLSGGNSSFDCSVTFTCTGDAARCAELIYHRRAYCDAKPTNQAATNAMQTSAEGLLAQTAAEARASLNAGTVNVAAAINRPRFLAVGVCPSPKSITLNLGFSSIPFAIDFQPLCDIAAIVRMFLILGASIIGVRIFIGGMN